MSQQDSGLESYLEELREEGSPHSSGVFTIDLERGLEKLRRFQLEGRVDYVAKALQAGVARGARALSVTSRSLGVSVRMSGVTFSRDEIHNLFESLLGSRGGSEQRALRALAIAINSALGRSPRGLWLRTCNGYEHLEHSWGENRFEHKDRQLRSSSEVYCELYVARPWADVLSTWDNYINLDIEDFLQSRQPFKSHECQMVLARWRGTTPLKLNNIAVNPSLGAARYRGCPAHPGRQHTASLWHRLRANFRHGIHPDHHILERFYSSSGENVSGLVCPSESCATISLGLKPGANLDCLVAIPALLDQPVKIEFVEDGILLNTELLPPQKIRSGAARGARVIVSTRDLSKDLTELNLLRNSAYYLAVETCRNRSLALWRLVRNYLDRYPDGLARELESRLPAPIGGDAAR